MVSSAVPSPRHLLSILVAVASVYFYYYPDSIPTISLNFSADERGGILKQILESLLKMETDTPLTHRPRVAVGYGGCLDVVVDARDVFNFSTREPSTKPKHHQSIKSWKALEEVFLYFFEHGASGERFVSDDKTWSEVIETVKRIQGRETIGGNAPVMSSRLGKEGCEVLLGADLSPKLRATFPPDVKITGSGREEDDVHLIIEHPFGDEWGSHHAPRANRFIIHSDQQNPKVSALEPFHAAMVNYNPHLFIVSGLQMMDNFPFPEGERVERIVKIRDQMKNTPFSTRVHFEMASYTDEKLLKDLTSHIIPYSDSLGMNEQELPNLFAILSNEGIRTIADAYPRVATTLDTMRKVFRLLQTTEETDGRRKLTRLHVHTLAYQAIMVAKGSPWKNTMAATAKASLTANRHVCGSEQVDVAKAKLIMDDSFSTSKEKSDPDRIFFNKEKPVSCWEEEENGFVVEICIAPVLVCTEVRQTAGGGDNISAGGLVLQI